jgi:hypothetical protein
MSYTIGLMAYLRTNKVFYTQRKNVYGCYEVIEHIMAHCDDNNEFVKTLTKQQLEFTHNMVFIGLMSAMNGTHRGHTNKLTDDVFDMYQSVFR